MSQDTDKLDAAIDRLADGIVLTADRLEDGWQLLSDGPALAAFLLEKETRDVLNSFDEIKEEAGDLKASEIAHLIKVAAERAESELFAAGK